MARSLEVVSVIQTMKFLLIVAVITLTNIGQKVRCQLDPDQALKECFIGIHCKLGPNVFKRAMKCANLLDQKSLLELEEWMEGEGFKGIVGKTIKELIEGLCAYPQKTKEDFTDAFGKRFTDTYSNACKNPEDPQCVQYTTLLDCYFELYSVEKPKNNCGYPRRLI